MLFGVFVPICTVGTHRAPQTDLGSQQVFQVLYLPLLLGACKMLLYGSIWIYLSITNLQEKATAGLCEAPSSLFYKINICMFVCVLDREEFVSKWRIVVN